MIQSLTVYCSSSRHVAPAFFDAAEQTGRAIAAEHWTLVYGGNAVGPMGRLADAARAAGGRVVGITPQLLVDHGIADSSCDELLVTESIRHRKQLMEQRGDAFLAMPGGLGTLEELFEIIVARHLHCHDKPIVLLNINNAYDPLLTMIAQGVRSRFINAAVEQLYFVAPTVPQAIDYLRRWP